MFNVGDEHHFEIDWNNEGARKSALNWFESGEPHALKAQLPNGEVQHVCAIATKIERLITHQPEVASMSGAVTKVPPTKKAYPAL